MPWINDLGGRIWEPGRNKFERALVWWACGKDEVLITLLRDDPRSRQKLLALPDGFRASAKYILTDGFGERYGKLTRSVHEAKEAARALEAYDAACLATQQALGLDRPTTRHTKRQKSRIEARPAAN